MVAGHLGTHSRSERERRSGGRRGSSSRQRLLDAAARLIVERGFDRINTNLVAREAGAGVGTFYKNFRDKYELRRQLVLHALELLGNELSLTSAGQDGSIERQVHGVVEAHVRFAEKQPHLFRAVFSQEGGGVAAGGRAAVGPSTRATERRLQQLRERGEIDQSIDPEVAARAFAAMQAGVLAWWLEDPTRTPRASLVATLSRLHPALCKSPTVPATEG